MKPSDFSNPHLTSSSIPLLPISLFASVKPKVEDVLSADEEESGLPSGMWSVWCMYYGINEQWSDRCVKWILFLLTCSVDSQLNTVVCDYDWNAKYCYSSRIR